MNPTKADLEKLSWVAENLLHDMHTRSYSENRLRIAQALAEARAEAVELLKQSHQYHLDDGVGIEFMSEEFREHIEKVNNFLKQSVQGEGK